VFVTRTGRPCDRHNVRQRVVGPAVVKADELLAEQGLNPLPAGVSPHKRHSFASLLVAFGRDAVYVMAQLGHTDPAFTLRTYTHLMRRDQGDRARLRALGEAHHWAAMGSGAEETAAEPSRSDAS
jgi:integrase